MFCLTILSSITSMYLSNDLATKGISLSKTEDKIFALQTENEYLYSKYYRQIALDNIASVASENGLAKAGVDFYTAPSFASR